MRFKLINMTNDDVFYNDKFILKTHSFSQLYKNKINQKCNYFDCKLIAECELNAEINSYLMLKKHPEIACFFTKYIKTIKINGLIKNNKNINYLDYGFIIEKINLNNEVKYSALKTDDPLYNKVRPIIDFIENNNITHYATDCSILYNDDLSNIKIIDFSSVNMFHIIEYLNNNWKLSSKIREYVMSTKIHENWNHSI